LKRFPTKTVRLLLELAVFALIAALFVRVLDLRPGAAVFRGFGAALTPLLVIGVLCFQVAIMALGSLCWGLILREGGVCRGAWRTFWARVSGFAITYLTPAVSLGGVPARAMVYQDDAMSAPALYATVAVDTFVEVAGKIPCMVAGFLILVLGAHPPRALAAAAAAALLLFTAFFAFLMVKLFGGASILPIAKMLLRPLARLSRRRAAAILGSLRIGSGALRKTLRRKRVFFIAFAVAVAISMVEVLQTFFIMAALDHRSLSHSFVIFSSILFQGIAGFLPGNLGVMEGAHLFLFTLLGIGTERSLLYTAVLRLGQVSIVALGLANILRWRIRRRLRVPRGALRGGAPG
jgi:uncharacterized protein (TIRG00374 family)